MTIIYILVFNLTFVGRLLGTMYRRQSISLAFGRAVREHFPNNKLWLLDRGLQTLSQYLELLSRVVFGRIHRRSWSGFNKFEV